MYLALVLYYFCIQVIITLKLYLIMSKFNIQHTKNTNGDKKIVISISYKLEDYNKCMILHTLKHEYVGFTKSEAKKSFNVDYLHPKRVMSSRTGRKTQI